MPEPYYADPTVTVHHGDCLDVLAELPDASIDAVVTDPPYGLEFMGKEWDAPWKADGTVLHDPSEVGGFQDGNGGNPFSRSRIRFGTGAGFQQWCQQWATECLRVLKPGGHLLAFGGTRTSHRLACAIEDAGFEIRDSIAWLYGSGFPKSLDVSKAIDKAAGAEREVLGLDDRLIRYMPNGNTGSFQLHGCSSVEELENLAAVGGKTPDGTDAAITLARRRAKEGAFTITAPATPDAERWQGWGTALKPAHEPVVVARKPLAGTVAANVLAHGTGALNVDGCRVDSDGSHKRPFQPTNNAREVYGAQTGFQPTNAAGRWPANVVLDESQAEVLDEQSGEQRDGVAVNRNRDGSDMASWYGTRNSQTGDDVGYGGSGGASRFFYTAKAASTERVRVDGTAHPPVTPLSLRRWLVRLVTPPLSPTRSECTGSVASCNAANIKCCPDCTHGRPGVVLEPFAGSGTTVEACILEGFRCVAIEREADYLPLIRQRIHRRRDPVEAVRGSGEDLGLFDLLGGDTA